MSHFFSLREILVKKLTSQEHSRGSPEFPNQKFEANRSNTQTEITTL